MIAPVNVGQVPIGGDAPLALLAGPCVIEDLDMTLRIAEALKQICQQVDVGLVFKASFDKANRSSVEAFRGPGLDEGLKILQQVKQQLELPVVTDIHDASQVVPAAEVVDILQIPAFLCRQTDLLLAAGRSQKVVNVKKGQFMAPWDMANVVDKIKTTGNEQIILTERGASFGYNNLVTDMRSLTLMREMGCPVIFDATHAVQLPGGQGTSSGGQRQFVGSLSRAAVATGIDALFWEVHPEPEKARCDGPNSLPLDQVAAQLAQMKAIDALVREN